jgi:dTDP-4-amino-4,6-dideoxygalactose transaminase
MTAAISPAKFPGVIGTFMGRDALALAICYLNLGPDDTVLLPAYTCKEVLRPFLNTTHIVFYDVEPDLTIHPNELKARMRTGKVKMMLMINYFGFLQPMREEIRQLCREHEVCLVEDCAHSLLTQGSGETGDLSVYSFRKILPLPDGGGLRVNSNGKSPSPQFHPRFYSDLLSTAIVLKSFFNIHSDKFNRSGITAGAKTLFAEGSKNGASRPQAGKRLLPLSRMADRGIKSASFPEMIERRRKDYLFWQEVCRGSKAAAPVFPELSSEVCPLGFAMKVKDRDALYQRALEQGIALRIHWRLSSTLAGEYRNSYEMSTQTLTLPVYPELTEKEREVLTGLIAGH